MSRVKLILLAICISLISAWVLSLFVGDGGLQRMTTISGVYAVKEPDGYPVVCFIERGTGGMQCLTYREMEIEERKTQ